MPIEDRMNRTATLKRGNGTLVSDGAGGYTQGATSVSTAAKYLRWVPNAYARTTIRTEMGLEPTAEVYNASMQYSASVTPAENDWLVEDLTGHIFRIVGAQLRTGAANEPHHWSLVLVKLTTEPVEA